jgi:hypothetical protein
MEFRNIIEGLVNSESNDGCDKGYTVVEKKWVKMLQKELDKMNRDKQERMAQEDLQLAKKDLQEERNLRAEDLFAIDKLDGLECVDSEGWQYDGEDVFLKKFYYQDEEDTHEDAPSLPATFIVRFKKSSTKVIEKHVNVW